MPHITINQNEYLAHSRTKGSKNGIRRYQNLDGTLTEEGKIHYGRMYGWGKNAQDYGSIANQGKNVASTPLRTTRDIYKDRKTEQIRSQRKEEAKTMTDQELSNVVKRLNLEKKYVDATTPEIKSGMDKALKALEVVGAVATTAIAVGKLAEMVSSHYISKDDEIRKAREK